MERYLTEGTTIGILSDWQIKRDIKITPFHDGTKEPGKISSGLTSYGYDVRVGYVGKIFSPIHATEIDPKNFDPKMLETVDLTPKTQWKCEWCGCTDFTYKDRLAPGASELPKHLKIRCAECDGANAPLSNYFRIPPHSFMLAESLETFDIPRDVLCVVVGKSTYARCGLIVNVTPGEPEWQGKWTVEISNTTPLPARVYVGEGIMQAMFFRSDAQNEMIFSTLKEMCDRGSKGGQYSYSTAFGAAFDLLRAMEDSKPSHLMSCERSYADKKGIYQGQAGLTPPKLRGNDDGTGS